MSAVPTLERLVAAAKRWRDIGAKDVVQVDGEQASAVLDYIAELEATREQDAPSRRD